MKKIKNLLDDPSFFANNYEFGLKREPEPYLVVLTYEYTLRDTKTGQKVEHRNDVTIPEVFAMSMGDAIDKAHAEAVQFYPNLPSLYFGATVTRLNRRKTQPSAEMATV